MTSIYNTIIDSAYCVTGFFFPEPVEVIRMNVVQKLMGLEDNSDNNESDLKKVQALRALVESSSKPVVKEVLHATDETVRSSDASCSTKINRLFHQFPCPVSDKPLVHSFGSTDGDREEYLKAVDKLKRKREILCERESNGYINGLLTSRDLNRKSDIKLLASSEEIFIPRQFVRDCTCQQTDLNGVQLGKDAAGDDRAQKIADELFEKIGKNAPLALSLMKLCTQASLPEAMSGLTIYQNEMAKVALRHAGRTFLSIKGDFNDPNKDKISIQFCALFVLADIENEGKFRYFWGRQTLEISKKELSESGGEVRTASIERMSSRPFESEKEAFAYAYGKGILKSGL